MKRPWIDWKYLICATGKPSWDEFGECATWQTQPCFDCTVVAEQIANTHVSDSDVTLCLEDPRGRRFEVDVSREEVVRYDTEEVVRYDTTAYRDLVKPAILSSTETKSGA